MPSPSRRTGALLLPLTAALAAVPLLGPPLASAAPRPLVASLPTVAVASNTSTSFSFQVSSMPAGATLKVTWRRNGLPQITTTKASSWWSGQQPGWSDAQGVLLSSNGEVLASSPLLRGTTPPPASLPSAGGQESVATISPAVPVPPKRGALPLGTAAYPIPPNALFVSTTGNDLNAGTKAAPLRTVARARDLAPAGGTIVLRGGEYHEHVFIGKSLTLQNYPGEVVWFDGSERATAWRAEGGVWKTSYPYAFDSSTVTDSDPFVNPAYPMAAHPDMVLLDGKQLKQVPSSPKAGEFAVDSSTKTLLLGSDPTGHEVRVATLKQALVVGAPEVKLRGFGVRRYANSASTYGVVYMARPGDVVENLVVQDVATTGITVSGDTTGGAGKVLSSTVERAGMLGIHGVWADGSVIANNVVTESNFEHFNAAPTSSGIKVGRTRGVAIDNNRVSNGYGTNGIWLDEGVVGFAITRNQVAGNGEVGIEAELSSSGVVASNQVVGHKNGLMIFDSEDVKVVNNTTGYNSETDLRVLQDKRRQATWEYGRDPRFPAGDPTNTWITRRVEVRNNLFGGDGNQKSAVQLYAMDYDRQRPAQEFFSLVKGNAFTPKTSDLSPLAVAWGRGPQEPQYFGTVVAFEGATGLSTGSLLLSTDAFGPGMEEARWDAHATEVGPEVGALLGVPATFKAIGSTTN